MRDYPLWFRLLVISVFLLFLGAAFLVDWLKAGYDGSPIELALIGAIVTVIGADQLRRGGDGK